MSLDDIINESLNSGGKWAKLATKGDKIAGELVSIDKRQRRTPEGDIVVGKKSGEPRTEWVITVRVPADQHEDADDDGLRKYGANEGAQRAVKEAIKRAGIKSADELVGCQFALAVAKEAEGKFEQHDYVAQVKPGTPKPKADVIGDLFD